MSARIRMRAGPAARPGLAPSPAQDAQDAGAGEPGAHLQARLAQHVGDAPGGAVLLEGQLGVAVQVAPEVDHELGGRLSAEGEGRGGGGRVHGRFYGLRRRLPGAAGPRARMGGLMDELAFRQVHLDFHTSGDIPDVGADFDPQEFVATLQRARVNSVTCFAKCHHGYSYYPTDVGVPHPAPLAGPAGGAGGGLQAGRESASRPTSRSSGTSRRRRRTRSGCRSTARGARWGGGPSTSPAGAGCASTRPTSTTSPRRRRRSCGATTWTASSSTSSCRRPPAASATPAAGASRSGGRPRGRRRPWRGRAWPSPATSCTA